nr:protein phosphatase 2C domain-containing protein [Vicinamibacterales bacterium]
MPDTSDFDTGEFEAHAVPPAPPSTAPAHLDVNVAARSDAGLVRDRNEDHFIVARLGRSLDVVATNLPDGHVPTRVEEAAWVLAVADGMGGAAAGEVASALALTVGTELTLGDGPWPVRLDEEEILHLRQRVTEYFHAIDRAVTARARMEPGLKGMGTTLTVAYSVGHDLLVFQVGDSRAYVWRQGSLRRLTRDQTVAQALVDAGHLGEKEAESHHLRHVLTKAIGTGECCEEAIMQRERVQPGDRLVLCTDGLTDMVPDAGIAEVL